MNKILVPFDFSDISYHALDFAIQMGNKAAGAEITLFNVIEHPSVSAYQRMMGVTDYEPMEILYIKQLIEAVEKRMAETISEYNIGKVKVTSKIRLGNPDNEIMRAVEDDEIDVIVMATSGAAGLDEFFVGSNAEKVVRHAACPVITMRNPAKAEVIKNIVFASDFENVNDDFIRHLKALRRLFDARLRIVKINTPANFANSRLDNKLMDKFVKKHDLGDCTIEIYNHSNEEDGIVAYAEDIQAQMIALGTHQTKGVNHFLKGSIAEDVVNHAPVPVWTYHLKAD